MALSREQIAADLVWRYVEHLRESRAEGDAVVLSREELLQLAEALETASRLPEALAADAAEVEAARGAVRRRLEPLLAEAPSAPAARPEPLGARLFRAAGLVPAWQLRAATAVCVALAVGLATVNLWHRPAPVVRTVRVPAAAGDVEPLDEQQAHVLIHQMVRNELAPRQERNLMWHMLVCPGCFDEYVNIKHQEQPGRTAARRQPLPVQVAAR